MTTQEGPEPLHVVHLVVENVKRLTAVDITPPVGEPLVLVAGANGAGKSSAIDAIWYALGGAAATRDTPRPVRDGADTARVRLDLGALVVTRTWQAGGRAQLVVESADGARYASPQTLLDTLVGTHTLDPLAFARASAREQRTVLQRVAGVNLDALEERRADLYTRRTAAGRDARAARARADAMADPGWDPAAPLPDVGAARAAFEDAVASEAAAAVRQRVAAAAQERLERLRVEVREAEAEAAAAWAALPDGDPAEGVEAARSALVAAEDARTRQREQAAYDVLHEEAAVAEAVVAGLSAEIADVDDRRGTAVAGAVMPVDGLAFTDDGVTLGGVPFSQASAAEQLRASVAIAAAESPRVRVVRVTDGSLLDDHSLALLGDLAREHRLQVWVERVGTADAGSPACVVIEDGSAVGS